MMNEGKNQNIGKKPPETHNAQRGLRLVVEAVFLNGNIDKNNAYKCQNHAGGRIEAGRIIKGVDGKAGNKSQCEQKHIGRFEGEQ